MWLSNLADGSMVIKAKYRSAISRQVDSESVTLPIEQQMPMSHISLQLIAVNRPPRLNAKSIRLQQESWWQLLGILEKWLISEILSTHSSLKLEKRWYTEKFMSQAEHFLKQIHHEEWQQSEFKGGKKICSNPHDSEMKEPLLKHHGMTTHTPKHFNPRKVYCKQLHFH